MHISEAVIRKGLVEVAKEMGSQTPKRVIEIVNGGEGASFSGVREQGVPMVFLYEDMEFALPEGLADGETIPEGVRRKYNKGLVRFGMTDMLLPEHTVQKLVRAHEWLWIKAGKPTGKPVKERKKPEPRPETVRNFAWKGEPVTEKQYEQRLRMSKGVVPENSGPIVVIDDTPLIADEVHIVQEPKAKKKAKKSKKKDAAKLEKALAVLGIDPKVLETLSV